MNLFQNRLAPKPSDSGQTEKHHVGWEAHISNDQHKKILTKDINERRSSQSSVSTEETESSREICNCNLL